MPTFPTVSFRARIALLAAAIAPLGAAKTQRPADELWRQVEIVRTTHGVPHIRAENLRAAGYALAWLQLEDYGPRTALSVLRAHGEMGRLFGRDSMESDFLARPIRARAIQTYHLLDRETRDVYEGFAAGVNRYVALHPAEFPAGMPTNFTGYDVATLDVGTPALGAARAFLARLQPRAATSADTRPQRPGEADPALEAGQANDNVGSNAWAFAPSRTRSRRAILLRNPHLAWNAGYYEGHMTVPGVIDFYGDFRIGSPFGVIGGFNKYLGFATTNNAQDLEEIYALDVDPKAVDYYLFEGTSVPLKRDLITVEFKNGNGLSTETREFWSTPLGPVIHRANGKIYLVKTAGDGEYRAGEQFLRMMRAKSLAEWKDAMKIRARMTSNFTYADRDGNIFYVWNAALPNLPHPPGDDTVAFPARTTADVWTRYVPFDSLPQFLNPKGGYIHNENSSPHFTNARQPLDTINPYPNFEPPSLSLRSQHAIELIDNDKKLTLEDVVALKHSYRMLLADRVKPDLITAVKSTNPGGDVAAALALLEKWKNTAAPESQGAMLFEIWWQRYAFQRPDSMNFARVWSKKEPRTTPSGLKDPARAAEAFAWAVEETARRHGRWDVAWGEVHRVRRGSVDAPVGGCSGALGCFRVLNFAREADGKLAANGGDGWVLAVEFTDTPRAYSVLAYGESPKPDSPWHAAQAEMFAKGQLKKVAFTPQDIEAQAVVRYRPGEKP
jgi:acyl-homoserine-lactone acylase